MTEREGTQLRLAVLIAGTLALLGMAWTSKADATEVENIARDVRDIKTLLCRASPDDTMCGRRE